MANPNDPIFSVDASQILVKLHLAGKSQVKLGFIVNTGIKNDTANAKDPEKPGNMTFDMSNASKTYQVCGISKNVSFHAPIDLSKRSEIVKAQKVVSDATKKAEKAKTTTESLVIEQNEDKPLLTDADEKPAKSTTSTEKEPTKPPTEGSAEKGSDKDPKKEPSKEEADLLTAKKNYIEVLRKIQWIEGSPAKAIADSKELTPEAKKSKAFLDTKKKEEDLSEEDKQILNILAAIPIENEYRNKKKNESIAAELKNTFDNAIMAYMTTFAGKEVASKIKSEDIAFGFIGINQKQYDTPAKIEKLYKNGKLETIDEKTYLSHVEKVQASKDPDAAIQPAVSYSFLYEVETETM